MGTRGYIGFRKNGVYVMVYNHYDSYPESLGINFVNDIIYLLNTIGLEGIIKLINNIRIINEKNETAPTPDEIKAISPYVNNIGNDWSLLTEDLQGKFANILNCGYIYGIVVGEKMTNIFIEYTYILNIDDNTIDFYAMDYNIIRSCPLDINKLEKLKDYFNSDEIYNDIDDHCL